MRNRKGEEENGKQEGKGRKGKARRLKLLERMKVKEGKREDKRRNR